jgi:hypothetical protein
MCRARLFATVNAVLLSTIAVLPAAETKTAIGIITSKMSKPASTYRSPPGGKDGAFSGTREIPIAQSVVFEIKVEGLSSNVRYSLNTIAAAEYKVGQRVRIEYVKRAVVPLRRRIYVRKMSPTK